MYSTALRLKEHRLQKQTNIGLTPAFLLPSYLLGNYFTLLSLSFTIYKNNTFLTRLLLEDVVDYLQI